MHDLRLVKPVKFIDDISGKDCFKIPVTITKISNKPTFLNIFGKIDGTECREMTVSMCGGNGKLIKQDAVMWETTFQNHNIDIVNDLPITTTANFTSSYHGDGFLLIVYVLNALPVVIMANEDPNYGLFDRTKIFVENYVEFFSWLKDKGKVKNKKLNKNRPE